jgi:predicted Holliday junction resolvase-like endonuclease
MSGTPDVVVILGLIAAASLCALVLVALLWSRERRRTQDRIEQLLTERERDLLDARRESVQKSRSSLKGQIAEQMAPLLPGFRYAPADARFIGDPIDYLVFSGYTGLRDARGSAENLDIVLLEVKQGGSALSPYQKAIARSVEEGRVRFEILRIADDGALTTETWRPR